MAVGLASVCVLVCSISGTFLMGKVDGQRSTTSDGDDLTSAAESGVSKIGGSHGNLPPCKTDGKQIIHSNISCIYIPTSSDEQRHKDGNVRGVGNQRNWTATEHGVARGGAGDMKGTPTHREPPDPYDRDGRYWLVPPFLIGASSVIVVYIVVHCLYLHCYAKRKMRQLVRRATSPPAIIFSDGDGPSVSSVPSFTPVVTYDGSSYGRTDLRESQPFIVYQPADSPEKYQPETAERRPSTRRKSMHLQLPNLFKSKGQPRASVCSASAAMETSTSSTDGVAEAKRDVRRARASICLVPVSRTISDPTGGARNQPAVEWTPLQGFVYPSVVLPSNASISIPSGSFSSISRDDIPSSPFILIQNPPGTSAPADPERPTQRHDSDTPKPSTRKTSFKEPEAETVTIPLTSHQEEEIDGDRPK